MVSCLKMARINTVNRQDHFRRIPSLEQSFIIQNSQIISKPNNGNSFTVPLQCLGCVSSKCFFYNAVYFPRVCSRKNLTVRDYFLLNVLIWVPIFWSNNVHCSERKTGLDLCWDWSERVTQDGHGHRRSWDFVQDNFLSSWEVDTWIRQFVYDVVDS